MQEQQNSDSGNRYQEIDLGQVIIRLWKNRSTILLLIFICMVIGFSWYCYHRFVAQACYKSEVTLLVSTATVTDDMITGYKDNEDRESIKLRIVTDSIPAELYPVLITGSQFLEQLLHINVKDPETGNQTTLAALITAKEKNADSLALLRKNLTIETTAPSILKIQLVLPETCPVNVVTDSLADLFIPYLVGFSTRKAYRHLKHITSLQIKADSLAANALRQLSEFHNHNLKPLLDNPILEEKRLQSNWKIAYERQRFLSREAEKAQLRIQAATPYISVVQPATAPIRTNLPNPLIICLVSVFVGCVLGGGIIFLRKRTGTS